MNCSTQLLSRVLSSREAVGVLGGFRCRGGSRGLRRGPRHPAVDDCADLADKSTVVVENVGQTTRFRLSESLRPTRGSGSRRARERNVRRKDAAYFAGSPSRPDLASAESMRPDGSNGSPPNSRTSGPRSNGRPPPADVDWSFDSSRTFPSPPTGASGTVGRRGLSVRWLSLESGTDPLFVAVCAGAARGAWMIADYRRAECLARRRRGRAAGSPAGARAAGPGTPYGDVLADVARTTARRGSLGDRQHEAERAGPAANPRRLAGAPTDVFAGCHVCAEPGLINTERGVPRARPG